MSLSLILVMCCMNYRRRYGSHFALSRLLGALTSATSTTRLMPKSQHASDSIEVTPAAQEDGVQKQVWLTLSPPVGKGARSSEVSQGPPPVELIESTGAYFEPPESVAELNARWKAENGKISGGKDDPFEL